MPPALQTATPSPLKAPSFPSLPVHLIQHSPSQPSQSVSKATGKGVFWGFSCLVCLLRDLEFGAKTANLLEERKRWGGGGAGQGRGSRVGAGEIGPIC